MKDICIPRIVMQTLYGYEEIPEKWRAGYDSVDRVMSQYKHVLLHGNDYAALVAEHFPDFWDTFVEYPYDIQRCDAIRYMWLYLHGGLYMDLDMQVTKDVSPLLQGCTLVVAEDLGGSAFTHGSAFLASVPRHPFWLDCLDLMKRRAHNWYSTKGAHVTMTTGPGIVSTVYTKYKDDGCTLPRELVYSCTLCDCSKNPIAFLTSLEGSGWMMDEDMHRVKVWCTLKRFKWLVLGLLCCTVLLVLRHFRWRIVRLSTRGR